MYRIKLKLIKIKAIGEIWEIYYMDPQRLWDHVAGLDGKHSSGIFSFRRAESKVSRKSFFSGFLFCNFTSATKEIQIQENQNNPNPKKTTNS